MSTLATISEMNAPKAVISTAGFGTRFFPVTKAVNKSLLPILNRPVIDYLITECVDAGISDIAIVVFGGDQQIRNYFSENKALKDYFYARGWESKYEPLAHLHDRARFTFIEQTLDGRYGTAIPPMLACDFVGKSDFFLLSADDLVLSEDGSSNLAQLLRTRNEAGLPSAMSVTKVPKELVSKYGIISTRLHGGLELLEDAIEKPSPEDAPTQFASVSRFLITADFFEYLDKLQPEPQSGEYLSITALVNYAKDYPVLVQPIRGTYYDCGTPEGWLKANVAAAAQ
jgi:UTP--glucose-1-phosphate uridylyltransferase